MPPAPHAEAHETPTADVQWTAGPAPKVSVRLRLLSWLGFTRASVRHSHPCARRTRTDASLVSCVQHEDERLAYGCYFLLGAGVLAPWNALLMAADYWAAVYPVRGARLLVGCPAQQDTQPFRRVRALLPHRRSGAAGSWHATMPQQLHCTTSLKTLPPAVAK